MTGLVKPEWRTVLMREGALAGSWLLLTASLAVAQPLPLATNPGTRATVPGLYDRDTLHPSAITIYGLVNAGLRQRDAVAPRSNSGPCTPAGNRIQDCLLVDSIERSRLGFRGDETLDGGLRAHFQLEQSLALDTGQLLPAGAVFGARATVGLSERRWGRVDFGRIEQAAWSLALRADPWGGSGTASPDWRLYVAPQPDATRSSGTVSYRSPADQPWQAVLQLGRPLGPQGSGHRSGGSLAWDRLPWLAGAGWQHWPDGSWAVPLVLAHDSGTLRWSAVLTHGRVAAAAVTAPAPALAAADGANYRNLFLGLSAPMMAKGDTERHEWRVGWNVHRVNGGSADDWVSDSKFGVGWRYRWSARSWMALGAALVQPRHGASRAVFDLSLSYAFERNLRTPQWPR